MLNVTGCILPFETGCCVATCNHKEQPTLDRDGKDECIITTNKYSILSANRNNQGNNTYANYLQRLKLCVYYAIHEYFMHYLFHTA